MTIENEPLELLGAQGRERLEVELNALFEGASGAAVRDGAGDGHRQQGQRHRHEGQLPLDGQSHARAPARGLDITEGL
jgi:hypothetical protein